MHVSEPETLVAELRALDGDGLRTVATYDREGYDFLYLRDDVTARRDDKADDIHDELVLQGLGTEYLEDLFEGGPLECSLHRFEDLTAIHFIDDAYTGLFVSVDSDADFPVVELVDICKSHT
jgi:hypothetical protein